MRQFTDKPIYAIGNYVYSFFTVNLLFILFNPLFFFLYLFVPLETSHSLVVFVSMITMGPAFGAVFYAMGKLMREKEISPVADFWRGYRMNFSLSIKYWLAQLVVLFILFTNTYYIWGTGQFSVFFLFFIVLMVAMLSINLYAFPILSRFEMTPKNLWIYATLYVFKYWRLTLFNLTTLVAFYLIYFQFPVLGSLFLISLTAYFILYNGRKVWEQMEEDKQQEAVAPRK